MVNSILASALIGSISAMSAGQLQHVRDMIVKPAVLRECNARGLIVDPNGYHSLMEMIKCRAMVVDLTKNANMSGDTKLGELEGVLRSVCAANFDMDDDEHISEECRNFFSAAYSDMGALDRLDMATDDFCDYLAAEEGADWDRDAAAEEIAAGTVNPNGARCKCLDMIENRIGAISNEQMMGFRDTCMDADEVCPGCYFIHAGFEVCSEFGIPESMCKASIEKAFKDDTCTATGYLRAAVIAPAALQECNDRGIIAHSDRYSSFMERFQCRAMLVDIARVANLDGRANDELKAAMKMVCGSEDGNEVPAACFNQLAARFPDMGVLAELDAASDGFCEMVVPGYSASASNAELVGDDVQAGGHRCNCLGAMKAGFGDKDLAAEEADCVMGNSDLPAPACRLVSAALAVCNHADYKQDMDCKDALEAAFDNDSC